MTNILRCGLSALAICGSTLLASADPLMPVDPVTVSTSGTFGAADATSGIAAPGASWNLSFAVSANPSPGNVGTDGFDIPYSDFQLRVGGTSISATPESIRLFGSANGGQFTLYFGPENGADPTTGNFIPELALSGDQLFYGSPQSPMLTSGSFNVSQVLYTDASNYDDILSPGITVNISAGADEAVPEPGTLAPLTLLSSILIACGWISGKHATFGRTR